VGGKSGIAGEGVFRGKGMLLNIRGISEKGERKKGEVGELGKGV